MGPDSVGQILSFPTAAMSDDFSGHSNRGSDAARLSADLLEEVDLIFEMRSQGLHQSAEAQSRVDAERARLQEEFSAVCGEEVRPAMEAFLERLRMNGGGGVFEERDGVQGAGVAPRVRLWMSLSGEIIGRPRQDQHPYLQLDLDIDKKRVIVAEGDMWKGHGTSGRVGTWNAPDITGEMVTKSLLGVLRRAAA